MASSCRGRSATRRDTLRTSGFALAQSPRDNVVEVSALVQESPPEIALSWLPNPQPIANAIITRNNEVVLTQSNTHKLSIRINTSTGCFHGSLVDTAKKQTLRGAFVNGAGGAQRGEGFFVGRSEAGPVLIEPAP